MTTRFKLVGRLMLPSDEAPNPVHSAYTTELKSEFVEISSSVGTSYTSIIRQSLNYLGNEISLDPAYCEPNQESVAGYFRLYDIHTRLWKLRLVFGVPEANYPHGLTGRWAGWWKVQPAVEGESLGTWIKSHMIEPTSSAVLKDTDHTISEYGLVE